VTRIGFVSRNGPVTRDRMSAMKTKPSERVPKDITCLECGFDYNGRKARCPLCGNVPQRPRQPNPVAKTASVAKPLRSPDEQVGPISPGDAAEEYRLAPAMPRPKRDLFQPVLHEGKVEEHKPESLSWIDQVKGAVDWSEIVMLAMLTAVFIGTFFLAPGLGIPFAALVLFASGLALGRLDLAAYVGYGLVLLAIVIAVGGTCLYVFVVSVAETVK
jgi:hypothetical protein